MIEQTEPTYAKESVLSKVLSTLDKEIAVLEKTHNNFNNQLKPFINNTSKGILEEGKEKELHSPYINTLKSSITKIRSIRQRMENLLQSIEV